jgi:hypothetical protein
MTISKNSVLINLQAFSTNQVGKENPIDLPVISETEFMKTLGEKIQTRSVKASIYTVKNTNHLYKIIQKNQFENGDEIRIFQIAAKLGIAPDIYSAVAVNDHVVIEMENAGDTFGKLATRSITEESSDDLENESKKNFQEIISKMAKNNPNFDKDEMKLFLENLRANSQFVITSTKKIETMDREEAIKKYYKNPEDFYFQLFSQIRMLAENKIFYPDIHVGNIIPNLDSNKGVQLIDFDSAELLPKATTKEILSKLKSTAYFQSWWSEFSQIKTKKSEELFQWFLSSSLDQKK